MDYIMSLENRTSAAVEVGRRLSGGQDLARASALARIGDAAIANNALLELLFE